MSPAGRENRNETKETEGRKHFLLLSLLATLALAFVLSACGSGDSTTVIQTTTVTGDSSAETTNTFGGSTESSSTQDSTADTTVSGTEGPTRDYTQFQSPSKNIGCVMFDGGARCDARKHQWDAGPPPANCPLDYGQGIQVGAKGKADFVCAGDTTLGAGPELRYGESSEVKGANCVSAEDGVTCTSSSGAGFFISIQSYKFTG